MRGSTDSHRHNSNDECNNLFPTSSEKSLQKLLLLKSKSAIIPWSNPGARKYTTDWFDYPLWVENPVREWVVMDDCCTVTVAGKKKTSRERI